MSATTPPMTIGIYHGYELTGSGSNEYTRYIARGLARLGHHVHVLCRDRRPASLDYVKAAYLWTLGGSGGLNATSDLLFLRDKEDLPKRETSAGGSVTVHVLPHAQIRPVFVCDKQRKGDVRMFIDLDNMQLNEYHTVSTTAVRAVLTAFPMQVVHANHLVYQPIVCADACAAVGVPFIIFPHGSSIGKKCIVSRRTRPATISHMHVPSTILFFCLRVHCSSRRTFRQIGRRCFGKVCAYY